jgi:hypothetical protein
VHNQTQQIALIRTRFNSVITISCLFPFIFQNWKNTSQHSEILRIFLNGGTGKVTMDVKQKQRAVTKFLLLKRCKGDDIGLRLENAYDRDAYCRASVFRLMNEIRCGDEELRDEGRPGRPYRYEMDVALCSILSDDPNASLRTIADTVSISPETVRTHMSRIGYTLKPLWWIPQALTSKLKQVHFNLYSRLLPMLRAHAHNNWRHLVTSYESWFLLRICSGPEMDRTGWEHA